MIRLSAEAEPEIYETTRTFGTILENVVVDERGRLDLDDDVEDREHARRVPARADLERAADEAGRPSDERRLPRPRTRSRSCRRSRGSPRRRRATASSPASRRSSPAPRSASPSRSRRSRRASAGRSCRSAPAVYSRLLGEKLARAQAERLAREHGLDGRAGGRAATACRSRRRARCCTPRSTAGSTSVEYRTDDGVRLRGAGLRAGRRPVAARPALDVARPGRLRREGRASWRRCSTRTSRSSRTSSPRSPPAARSSESRSLQRTLTSLVAPKARTPGPQVGGRGSGGICACGPTRCSIAVSAGMS